MKNKQELRGWRHRCKMLHERMDELGKSCKMLDERLDALGPEAPIKREKAANAWARCMMMKR